MLCHLLPNIMTSPGQDSGVAKEETDVCMYVNIDGDDNPDLLFYLKEEGEIKKVSWERHTNSTTSMARYIILPDFPVWAVGVIDIDQDGDGDILFTNKTDGLLYVAEQICSFRFDTAKRVESTQQSYDNFKVHDANSDGIDDLVGASFSRAFTYVMQLGLGNGEFASPKTASIGYTQIFAQRYQDLNGDGYSDITVTTGGASRIIFYPGLASGGWGSEITVLGISNAWGSAIGDIDGDGLKDVIAASFNGNINTVILARNLGNNTFERQTLISGISATTDLECTDLDGDGLDEILLSSTNGNDTWLYRNNGNLDFSKTKIADISRGNGGFTDLDGDGDIDITLYEVGGNDVIDWWEGNSNGSSFSYRGQAYPRTVTSPFHVIADFDQDQIPDMVFASIFHGKNAIWFAGGYGDGYFKEEQLLFKTNDLLQLEADDLDQDGKTDLIWNANQQLFSAKNKGAAVFSDPEVIKDQIFRFEAIDTHNDDYLDYLIISQSRDSILLLSYEPDGSSSIQLIQTDPSLHLSVDDFNQDGFQDFSIYSSGFSEKTLSIYLNRFDQFEPVYQQPLDVFRIISGLQSIDYDQDGTADILLTLHERLHWMRGNQFGGYDDPEPTDIDEDVYTFTTIDIDGDKKKELYISNGSEESGYYEIKGPGFYNNKQYVLFEGEAVRRFTELNWLKPFEVLSPNIDGIISWWIDSPSKDYPFIITQYPCSANASGTVKVIRPCNSDVEIVWEDGSREDTNANLGVGFHSYFVMLDQDTLEQVNFELEAALPLDIEVEVIADEGNGDGAFRVSIQGGLAPYELSWQSSNGESGTRRNQLTQGTYTLSVTDAWGCLTETTFTVPMTTSTTSLSSVESISLYPSISFDQITIQSTATPIEQITIMDMTGNILSKQNFQSYLTNIQVGDLPSGLYYVLVKTQNQEQAKRFIRL